ncbi:MAG: T9SS type A sorting domain-containing protein [Flavobacteriales bacterium]|nr:T9SS type A sorting domain-containing protein [Flavobacteriales bacterium]
MISFRTLSLAFGLTAAAATSAQLPTVDIGLFDNGLGQLEVRLRPDATFNEFFSSLVFTVRWDAASGANLDAVAQVAPESNYMPVLKSGGEVDDQGYRYQVFAGFGTAPLSSFGLTWASSAEITLLTMNVLNGTSVFEIANDAWTTDPNNNGDFYVSLNGEDKTGVVYQISTGLIEGVTATGWSMDVLPNPTDGASTITIDAPEGSGRGELELINAAGQRVWSRSFSASRGTVRSSLDLTPFEAGVYTLRLRCDDQVITRRVVRR